MEEAWRDLANAVVTQAARDYRYYRRQMHRTKDEYSKIKARIKLEELEKFFLSDRCSVLSGGLNEMILRRLKAGG